MGAFAEDTKAMVVRCKLPSHLVVDLSEVMFVDGEGEEVLLWLARIGAQFVASVRYFGIGRVHQNFARSSGQRISLRRRYGCLPE